MMRGGGQCLQAEVLEGSGGQMGVDWGRIK